jgi:hypothetical protein
MVREAIAFTAELIGRSFFPILALVVILGTIVWGPWVSLFVALVVWAAVTRYV